MAGTGGGLESGDVKTQRDRLLQTGRPGVNLTPLLLAQGTGARVGPSSPMGPATTTVLPPASIRKLS